jgi:hypothetical protein
VDEAVAVVLGDGVAVLVREEVALDVDVSVDDAVAVPVRDVVVKAVCVALARPVGSIGPALKVGDGDA